LGISFGKFSCGWGYEFVIVLLIALPFGKLSASWGYNLVTSWLSGIIQNNPVLVILLNLAFTS